MLKKRTSPESSYDEQKNEGSDSVQSVQEDDNAKRAKLAPCYDTTLHDLPMELIECILVKAVAMEVKGLKLAKSVWKEKADPVISRLRTVCSQWSSILTTNFFRNELRRTLDGLETVRMEIVQKAPLVLSPGSLTTMKDEIFILYRPIGQQDVAFHVFDRNNMAQVKDVIPLPGMQPASIVACNVSNCLYVMNRKRRYHISVDRVLKEGEHQFRVPVSAFIDDMWMPSATISVTANDRIILSSQQRNKQLTIIKVFGADGSLQNKMRLFSDILEFYEIIPKSNGNLVLVSPNDNWKRKLTEIDMDGTILRQYNSSIDALMVACEADKYGRMMIVDRLNRMELIDSEFNLMEFTGPQLDEGQSIRRGLMHYNSERNEVVTVVKDGYYKHGVLTIFRFTDE